jgi:hypothetical protein
MADPEFRRDLYQGATRDYDRFWLAYPQPLTDDLVCAMAAGVSRSAPSSRLCRPPVLRHAPPDNPVVAASRRAAGIAS